MKEISLKQQIVVYTKAISICDNKPSQQALRNILKDGLIDVQNELLKQKGKK